jgi:hypothetical protein
MMVAAFQGKSEILVTGKVWLVRFSRKAFKPKASGKSHNDRTLGDFDWLAELR